MPLRLLVALAAVAALAAGPSEAARPLPLAGVTVVVDPGHNGGNARHPEIVNRLVNAGTLRKACDSVGASTAGGYAEAAYNWDVANRVATLLRRDGARVVLTRRSNAGAGPCITERAAIANRLGADVAISIHADGGPSYGRGFHVIYPPRLAGLTEDIAAPSRRLAVIVRDAYHGGTGMPFATYVGRRALDVRSDLGGLNLSDVPKVFIETGNLRNARDAALLTSPAFRARAARGLATALGRFVRPGYRRSS